MIDKIYEFDTVIYPVKLYITLCEDEDIINKKLEYCNAKKDIELDLDAGAETLFYVQNKKDRGAMGEYKVGVLIALKEEFLLLRTIAHECTHFSEMVFEFIGEHSPASEQRAYLTGWAGGCCERVVQDYMKYKATMEKEE